MDIVSVAAQFAIEHHAGVRNKHDGEVYLKHVYRVAQGARDFARQYGVDEDLAEATGWLHDVVEDTVATLSDVTGLFGDIYVVQEINPAVNLLTKKDGQPLEDYYAAIAQNDLARVVKLADLRDNFRRNHLIVDDQKRLKMAHKYSLGMDILS